MNNQYQFPEFDTSFWKIKDKEWMAERKQQWETIELMLEHKKPKKGRTVIKNYFLKGKLPDWDKLRHWDSYERHLDVFLFLWLHPSSDKEVLFKLFDDYIHSVVIRFDDIAAGYGMLLREFIIMASQDYSDDLDELKYCILTDSKVEVLFEVMMKPALNQLKLELSFLYLDHSSPEIKVLDYSVASPRSIYEMGRWLCIQELKDFNNEFLFQFDDALEWWYQSFPVDPHFFENEAQSEAARNNTIKALYRIHHFDTEKEGDTCRTRFVHKIRKILDERDFIPEFKQMWEDVKSGKIEVKDPWKR